MSSSLSSGQVVVMMNSALVSMMPDLASGRISAKATNTIIVKPRSTLNRMSVNGTKVPSSPSAPVKRLGPSIVAPLDGRDDMDLGNLGDGREQLADGAVELEVLELEDQRGADAGNGDVQRNRHAAGHAGERAA